MNSDLICLLRGKLLLHAHLNATSQKYNWGHTYAHTCTHPPTYPATQIKTRTKGQWPFDPGFCDILPLGLHKLVWAATHAYLNPHTDLESSNVIYFSSKLGFK